MNHSVFQRLLLAAFAFAVLAVSASPVQAEQDYCRFGSRSVLFLVDVTSPYDDTNRRVVVESLGGVLNSLASGDRLVMATIERHYSETRRVFNACLPGCPPSSNPLFSSCSGALARRDRQGFEGRLAAAIRPLAANARNLPNSDITGTVAQETRSPLGGRPYSQVYIYSDMLENSQALAWARLRAMEPAAAIGIVRSNNLIPSVHNAEVRIAGFGRLHNVPHDPLPAGADMRLREFWRLYFEAGGARSTSFVGAISN